MLDVVDQPMANGASVIPIDIGKLDSPNIVPKCRRPKYSPRIACSRGVRAPNPTPHTMANAAAKINVSAICQYHQRRPLNQQQERNQNTLADPISHDPAAKLENKRRHNQYRHHPRRRRVVQIDPVGIRKVQEQGAPISLPSIGSPACASSRSTRTPACATPPSV